MTKMILALCSAATMLANVCAAPKLPKYGTEAWCRLPGAKEVIRAAETGDVFAKYFLAMIAEVNGNPEPMDNLYKNPQTREFIMNNEEKLSEALRKFSDLGFYFTQQLLADVYLKMQLTDISLALYRKAADQGDPVSQYYLGLLLYNQKPGRPQAPAETVKLWENSAAQGNVGAIKDMGLLWLKGEVNGKTDIHKAIKYLAEAARLGHIQAMYVLGEIHEKGLNGKVDKDLAIKYYKKAAVLHPALADLPDPDAKNKGKNSK